MAGLDIVFLSVMQWATALLEVVVIARLAADIALLVVASGFRARHLIASQCLHERSAAYLLSISVFRQSEFSEKIRGNPHLLHFLIMAADIASSI